MADNVEIKQNKNDDTLNRLVRILARKAAREVFEQQNLKTSDEPSTGRAASKADEAQS